MPLPTTYSTGTASVANGATTLTIVGAVSNAIYAGDFFMDPAQPLVPPQRIASVTGGGVYELAVGWPGTTMVAAPYVVHITPDSVRVQERTRAVLEGLDQRGLPQGGDAGQVLAKVSGDDYAVEWVENAPTAADVPFAPTGDLTSTNTQAAIVEVNGKIAAAAAGVAKRGTVRAATVANITIATALNNGDSLDGVTLATGDLVLVKNQAAPAENGVYVVGTSPARSSEFDTYNEHPGALIVVQEGTTLADSFWYCTSNAGGTLGSSSIVFAQLSLTPADGSITYAKMASGVIREKLSANRTYYVRSDGSDSNNGLANTAVGAFLTIQKAIDTVALLDTAIYDVTIQVGAGTYAAANTLKAPAGSGSITIVGDTITPGNVIVSATSADSFLGNNAPGRWIIKGFKLQSTTSGSGIKSYQTYIEYEAIDFGACATAHIWVEQNGYVTATGNYSISGGSTRHLFATNGGVISITGKTITITGTPAFSSGFVIASRSGASMVLSSNTYSGSATGSRYVVSFNASIDVAGAGATYFPGNAAGSATAGGQYA